MKNPLTPAGIEPATFRIVALCYRGPQVIKKKKQILCRIQYLGVGE